MIVTLRRNGTALSVHESLTAALRTVQAIDGPERRVVVAFAQRKQCSMCEASKPLAAFHRQPTGKYGRHSYCAECANGVRNVTRPTTSDGRGYDPEQKKRWQLKSRYGITPADYEGMLAEQDGNCAICGDKPERPCVDHNHDTGVVRAILCHRCNIGLPYVEDADYRLRAIAYLERYNTVTDAVSFISMFSGIEAASMAFNPLGWKAVCFAEIEKFPSAVLRHHYPDTPNVGDMSKHDWAQYRGKVDIVCGGPPCQAFSVAGLRGSLDDARGNLSLTYMKALHAIKPRNAIVENVPGWLSTKDNAFGCFLAGLVGADDALPSPTGKRWPSAGMVSGPQGRAAWRVLDAQYFGLAQRRKRVIVVADFGNGADPAAVLFEPEGVRRHSPPSRETGQGIAGTISSRPKGSGGLGTDFDLDGGLIHAPEIARCVATREGSSQDYETTTMVAVGVSGSISHAPLAAEGADASEDGLTCSQKAAVAFSSAVRRLTPRECERLQGFQFLVRPDYPQAWQDDAGRWWSPDYTAIPVRKVTAANQSKARADDSGMFREIDGEMWIMASDGPRYKSLGNSWAVPKFRWLGRRIQRLMPPRR